VVTVRSDWAARHLAARLGRNSWCPPVRKVNGWRSCEGWGPKLRTTSYWWRTYLSIIQWKWKQIKTYTRDCKAFVDQKMPQLLKPSTKCRSWVVTSSSYFQLVLTAITGFNQEGWLSGKLCLRLNQWASVWNKSFMLCIKCLLFGWSYSIFFVIPVDLDVNFTNVNERYFDERPKTSTNSRRCCCSWGSWWTLCWGRRRVRCRWTFDGTCWWTRNRMPVSAGWSWLLRGPSSGIVGGWDASLK